DGRRSEKPGAAVESGGECGWSATGLSIPAGHQRSAGGEAGAVNIVSLGAGGQSTTMLLMAAHGEITAKRDAAICAETGWEPARVYRHLDWLTEEAARYSIKIIRVSNGNIRDDLYRAVNEGTRFPSMPFFLKGGGIHRPGDEGR